MSKPEILKIGFKVNEPQLWAVELPVEEINIRDIKYNLDILYLEKEGTDDWNLSPRKLIENFDQEKSHAKRVAGVDLIYPIDIYLNQDKWIILDGVHRFTKAVKEGRKIIKVRKIPHEVAYRVRRK